MKVRTEEQRQNPKRKKRLRKKLHVAEFKEYFVKLSVFSINSETPDDEYDDFLDTVKTILDINDFGIISLAISDRHQTSLYVEVNQKQYSDHILQKVVSELQVVYDSLEFENVDDAWYPNDDE